MALIKPEEYDQHYFDGKLGHPHPEGYYEYLPSDWMSGELDAHLKSLDPASLANKTVLEIGCAKGYLVQRLRQKGVDAFGIDISQYAIDNAPDDVKPYVSLGTVYDLNRYFDQQFDLVFSVRLMSCLDYGDFQRLFNAMSRIARHQVHIIDEPSYGKTQHYTLKTKEDYLKQNLPKGTRIISYQTGKAADK